MAALPVQYTIPASVAALSYLDAKFALRADVRSITNYLRVMIRARVIERRDKCSLFYSLELHALTPATSSRPFLLFKRPGSSSHRTWTYKDAYELVLKYGQWFRSLGVKTGEVVAIDFTNSDTFMWLWFGLWSIGAKPAFINTNLGHKPLLHSIRTSGARIIIIDRLGCGAHFTPEVIEELSSESFRDTKDFLGGSVQCVFWDEALEGEILAFPAKRERDEVRGAQKLPDMAMLIYTSGTTGLPKPAVVSWSKCRIGGHFVTRWLPFEQDDIMYTCMPLYHSSAALLAACSTVQSGITLSLGASFHRSTFWEEVRATKATIIQYVGEVCRYLLSAPPSPLDTQHSVRVAFGNGLRPDVWDKFKSRYNIDTICEFYAATEGPGGMWNKSRNGFTQGAVGRTGLLGRALLGRNLCAVKFDINENARLRDPATGMCMTAGPDEAGEVLYKLDEKDIRDKFQGYYRNEGATNSKIVRDVITKGDAYFSTGDLLRRDAEGRWWFIDRIGDTFRWKSENVSTAEVAQVLGTLDFISEANVYGVQLPGHDGRAGCAAISLKDNETTLSEATRRELAAYATESLPRFAVPVFLRITRSMQTTGTHKFQKGAFREQGVDPGKISAVGDELYWLRPGSKMYESFGEKEWNRIVGGDVKL